MIAFKANGHTVTAVLRMNEGVGAWYADIKSIRAEDGRDVSVTEFERTNPDIDLDELAFAAARGKRAANG